MEQNYTSENRFYLFIAHELPAFVKCWVEKEYTFREFLVLQQLSCKEMCTHGHLVAELNIEKSQVSRMIIRLEGLGLVSTNRSLQDKRTLWLGLTKKGMIEIQRLIEVFDTTVRKRMETFEHRPLEEYLKSFPK